MNITLPQDSDLYLEKMLLEAEAILQILNIPYRVVQLASNDMGFSAHKTYDIEAWLPGQNSFLEL